jgi:hypothetical protein
MAMVHMRPIVIINLLLGKQAPGISGNFPFFAVHIDDKKFTFRPDKCREVPIQKFCQ